MKNIRKKFLFLVICILTSCAAIGQDKILTMDDFVGEYGDEKQTWFYVGKFDDEKYSNDFIIYNGLGINEETMLCKFDKATTKRVYLDCYNPNTKIERFRYPYLKLKLEPYGWVKVEIYNKGKKYYEKYNCAKEEDASHYTQRCKESTAVLSEKKRNNSPFFYL